MNTETTLDKDVTAIDTTTAGEGAEAKLPLKLDDSAPVAQSQIDADWEAKQRAEIDTILNGGGGDQPGETPENGTEPAPTPTEPPPAEPPPVGDTPQPPAAQLEARNFEAELAQARLEAECAAYGRMGGELQQLRDEVKRLREQPAHPTPPPPPPPAAEPTDADLSAVLGEKWQDDWGRDGAVTEYKRLQKAAQHFGAASSLKTQQLGSLMGIGNIYISNLLEPNELGAFPVIYLAKEAVSYALAAQRTKTKEDPALLDGTLLHGWALYDWGVTREEGISIGWIKPNETALTVYNG